MFKSDFAFRLLMNGQMLTAMIEGCPPDADLCDVQVLLDRVAPFATADRDCNAQIKEYPAIKESKLLLSTTGGIILVLFVTIASALLGSLFTFYYMTRQLPCRKRSAYEVGMAISASSNGISSYHDEVEGFRDEPDDLEDNVQLRTVAALVE